MLYPNPVTSIRYFDQLNGMFVNRKLGWVWLCSAIRLHDIILKDFYILIKYFRAIVNLKKTFIKLFKFSIKFFYFKIT